MADTSHGDQRIIELLPVKHISQLEVSSASEDDENFRSVPNNTDFQMFSQRLIEFPDTLSNLRTLPLLDMMNVLHSFISTPVITCQKIVALFWPRVVKCSQPEPCSALLILAETSLYTLTTDSGPLVLFHHFPLLQLKQVHTDSAFDGLYRREHPGGLNSQPEADQRAMLGHTLCHLPWGQQGLLALLHRDLMRMSLEWQTLNLTWPADGGWI